MIEAAQRKLAETRFFFGHLREESQKAGAQDPAAVGYYLSAFLSAERSVTFALQFEEKVKYDAWFPEWLKKCGKDEQKLLDEMNAYRVAEVHKDGVETTVKQCLPLMLRTSVDLQSPNFSPSGTAHTETQFQYCRAVSPGWSSASSEWPQLSR